MRQHLHAGVWGRCVCWFDYAEASCWHDPGDAWDPVPYWPSAWTWRIDVDEAQREKDWRDER